MPFGRCEESVDPQFATGSDTANKNSASAKSELTKQELTSRRWVLYAGAAVN